jgi:hypothetical protein
MTSPRRWTPKTTICRSKSDSGEAGRRDSLLHVPVGSCSHAYPLSRCPAVLLISPVSRRSPDFLGLSPHLLTALYA